MKAPEPGLVLFPTCHPNVPAALALVAGWKIWIFCPACGQTMIQIGPTPEASRTSRGKSESTQEERFG